MAFQKGQSPWNKGKRWKKGKPSGPPWNKGKIDVYSHETLTKMSLAHNGKTPANRGISLADHYYPCIKMPNHPRASTQGNVQVHILKAEKALGKSLPTRSVVHHYTTEQLVICQDQAYHAILHQRTRALAICGHASWLKCPLCKTYDFPERLYLKPSGDVGGHNFCRRAYRRAYYERKGV